MRNRYPQAARKLLLLVFFLLFVLPFTFGQSKTFTRDQYQEDFLFFWKTIGEDYAYFDKKQTDWNKVKDLYLRQLDTVSTNRQFVSLLERAFHEIYDHHASLNTNTNFSPRLVPSGTDLWAEFVNGKPIVLEVRRGLGAEKVGMQAGMEVVSVNDVPVQAALSPFLGKSLKTVDVEAKNYALRTLLAGNHVQPRKITVQENGKLRTFYPDAPQMLLEDIQYPSKVEARELNGIGYIKINNCLFDNSLIPAFDSVLNTLTNTKALVLDLRETPSGGNTTVARAILGRFITKDEYYQKHELTAEERQYGVKRSWVEIASPRGNVYRKPLAVLVGHWTGSVGEGITIAFDGMKRGTIIGSRLAGLSGAIYSYQLPNTRLGFSFPVEKLFHVNGSPRENYSPAMLVDLTKESAGPEKDVVLEKAITFLNGKKK
ncbi:S41 family peptidase [Sabulibacter ruber]|uniref:S41 family peptidase n=1 Tax=Sabulibacter ruber TaxID=2811901 RepID=UPI001A979419|nr:S41 family peptidase [Sabulibacter ruber]